MYTASVNITGDEHNHAPEGTQLRGLVTTELLSESSELCDAGSNSLGAVVRYMERKEQLHISIRSLRRRMSAQGEEAHPRATETARLIQRLSAEQAEEPILRLKAAKTFLCRKLCDIWWAYPECLRDYVTYRVVPGSSTDGKALENRFNVPLSAITGTTNS